MLLAVTFTCCQWSMMTLKQLLDLPFEPTQLRTANVQQIINTSGIFWKDNRRCITERRTKAVYVNTRLGWLRILFEKNLYGFWKSGVAPWLHIENIRKMSTEDLWKIKHEISIFFEKSRVFGEAGSDVEFWWERALIRVSFNEIDGYLNRLFF